MSGSQPLTQANWDKLLRVAKQAIEKADFDSGWIATPSAKVIKHNLGVLPSEVWVYASASSSGTDFQSDTFTLCGRTNITVNGALGFCRVRMNKGG